MRELNLATPFEAERTQDASCAVKHEAQPLLTSCANNSFRMNWDATSQCEKLVQSRQVSHSQNPGQ